MRGIGRRLAPGTDEWRNPCHTEAVLGDARGALPTVDSSGPHQIVIHTRDHPPAHVHVLRDDCEAIVELSSPARVRKNWGFPDQEIRRVLDHVEVRMAFYQSEWRRIHGSA